MQMVVLALTLVLMGAVVLAFVAAVRAAGRGVVSASTESRRGWLIAVLLVVGVVVSVLSLRPWPHAVAATVAVVNVSGGQWYWEIDAAAVPLGKPVAFNVHTVDVNHGFGVMDPSGRMLFQIQAMPGYVNQVEYTFDTPGTYRVVCLEYCGLAHHEMLTEFNVAAD